ncbi:alpha/beta hydrolase family protein [Sphingobacterium sp. UBA6645]|uniref:alpha/beta hydrolase family protein n=1 Tax=Sphingobacterium sp. UBA6645 TaxID=1947511 RepID=UPI0025FB04EF|nr:alpha/beta fold hydrolase [Sphingobacterium sp. UBA6645]
MIKKYFLFIFSLSFSLFACGQSFEGSWTGTLVLPTVKLPTVFEFTYDGQWKGTMQSPSQSMAKLPFSAIEADGDSIHVEVRSFGIKYSGKLSSDKQAITGQVQQGSMRAPLDFKKGPWKSYKRPQAVNPPYSYDTVDVKIPNREDNVVLAGTITRPKSGGKHPGVVLVTGSGPQDRNSSIYGHQSFKLIADYLTKRGIVVLRYDDRGVGQSTGIYTQATTSDFGKDALSALNYLSKQADVDPKKVGVIGHSEGGLIATILAGQRVPSLKFIVDLAGPAIAIDSLMVLQSEAVMKVQGKTMSAQDRALIKKNYEIVKSKLSAEEAFEALMANMRAVPGSQNVQFGDEIGVLVTPWYRHFMKIDPIHFIKKINIPVFAAFGGTDVQVIAAPNMESLTDNLPRNLKSIVKVYPGLNHLFQTSKSGSHLEYGDIEETFSPEVLKDMADWILSRD